MALRATPGDATGIPLLRSPPRGGELRFAPVRGAATLVRTCCRGLFFPVRPRTSSTASRSPFPVRGDGLASPLGKLSAQLTEGVTARRSLLFPYKSKYVQDLVHGPLSALRATPGDATGIPRFAPPCAGTARDLLCSLFCRRASARAEGCIPPGGAQRLPVIAWRGRGRISGALAPGVKKGFFPCQLPDECASFKQRAFRTFVGLR